MGYIFGCSGKCFGLMD